MMDSWYCPIKIIQSDRPKKYRFISKKTEFAKITVSGYILGSNSEISNV